MTFNDQPDLVQQKIDALSHFFLTGYENERMQDTMSVLSGRGGTVVLQAVLYETSGRKEYKDALLKNIDYIFNTLDNSPIVLSTHCAGLAGVGWLLDYLCSRQILDTTTLDDFFEQLDDIIPEQVQIMNDQQNFDLLHGSMGLCLYIMNRGKDISAVESTIHALFERAETDSLEVKWRRFDEFRAKDHIYDYGLAHGMAGILYFLGKCYSKGILPDKCETLIRGNMAFFLGNQQQHEQYGCFYPSSIVVKDYKKGQCPPSLSRLAWCYGDLGILYTHLLVARWLNDKPLETVITNMLLVTATRLEYPETLIKDAGFCHGATGVGYMFKKLYKLTGNKTFSDTAEKWLNETISMGDKGADALEGYQFYMGDAGWMNMPDILNGVAAVALFLVSMKYPEMNTEWDECLFLS